MDNYSPARAAVAVAGARGYAGRELVDRLQRHPGVTLVATLPSARDASAASDLLAAAPDFVFLALPHEASLALVPRLLAAARPPRVIDLSGAFRLDPAAFERWYREPHTAAACLDQAVYGWPEKNRARIRSARLIANPGCYATAVLTALWPLVRAGVLEPGVVCDAKSGASGAGRGLREDLHFVELEANCKAYSIGTHRHVPEIARETGLGLADFTFVPHLLPTSRGILATHHLRIRGGETLGAIYGAAWAGEPFVRLRGEVLPELNDVTRTNYCDLGCVVDDLGRAVVVTCLDNLVKGAAGQAIQNFNLMAGWPETTALL